MREIEVKAYLKNRDYFLNAAKNIGITFNTITSQIDTTYEIDLPYDDPNWNIFRLRKQNGKIILTMKHKASTRARDNYEYETTISNENEIIKMLERLGYNKGVTISKSRITANYKNYEICIDEIEKLGNFVEVEMLASDHADVDKIQSDLWDLLKKLGIKNSDRIHKGYDTLMHDLIKSNV